MVNFIKGALVLLAMFSILAGVMTLHAMNIVGLL